MYTFSKENLFQIILLFRIDFGVCAAKAEPRTSVFHSHGAPAPVDLT